MNNHRMIRTCVDNRETSPRSLTDLNEYGRPYVYPRITLCLTCAAAGRPVAATSFASRGSAGVLREPCEMRGQGPNGWRALLRHEAKGHGADVARSGTSCWIAAGRPAAARREGHR